MFPELKEDVIARVVSSTLTIEEAVDMVLKIQACMRMSESDEGEKSAVKDDVQSHNQLPQILTAWLSAVFSTLVYLHSYS